MEQPGREELIQWKQGQSTNYFTADPGLRAALSVRMGDALTDTFLSRLSSFGEAVATVIEPAVQTLERNREFPKLRPYDEVGRRIDEVEFHPAQRDAARAAWASGMLATTLDYVGAFETASLFFLLSHVGEGGQACPIVCTIGLRRALEHRASDEIKGRYLPRLTGTDAASALRGSQFLTEVQGGSDVGANVTRATPDPDTPGAWRVSGEKWFCSVADADLFAVTARPDGAGPGTKGLACFVVPRSLDGTVPNGFRIRRLKDKLGTRALASAEIDFENAMAWPIGALDEGFSIAVTELLNTSRWLNAVGSAGIMSRTYIEASSFARSRTAFGAPISNYPGVREQLAIIKSEAAAALASTFALTEFVARIDAGAATEEDVAIHRFLVNANKFVTSLAASDVVHRGIEVLGGNGTIEDFSPLPRLYRDAVVFESWEGTHNVLCAQVHRDCRRRGLLDPVVNWITAELDLAPSHHDADVAILLDALAQVRRDLDRSVAVDEHPGDFRSQLSTLMEIVQATCLLRHAGLPGRTHDSTAVASLFMGRHIGPRARVEERRWTAFVDAALDR